MSGYELGTDNTAPRYGAASATSTFVQWKGTSLCMDLICRCGEQWHWDGFFAYFLRCPSCGAVYALPTNLRLRDVDLATLDPDLRDRVKDLRT